MRTIIYLIVFTAACQAQSINATLISIAGTVQGSDGTTVTNGLVSAYFNSSVVSPKAKNTFAQAGITSVGTFQLGPLIPGTYRICVQASLEYLNSCEWSQGQFTVTISPGKPATNVAITLAKAAALQVTILDAAGLLSSNEGKTSGAHLLIGTTNDAFAFRTAIVTNQTATGRTYQLSVPFGRTINLSVVGGRFQVADATGKLLPSSNTLSIAIPAQQQPPPVALIVTGFAGS